MRDKRLEANIKKVYEFIELWAKLHENFKDLLSSAKVGTEVETNFVTTRNLVYKRYEDLMDSLGVKPLRRFIISPAIYNILTVSKLSTMSDAKIEALKRGWVEAENFLNMLARRLERKKRRIEDFNKFVFVFKRIITGRI